MNPPAATGSDENTLRDALKRCSPATIEAACSFRRSRDLSLLPTIVRGVIARFVERELRDKLDNPSADLKLAEDLQLDSLTMMEIVMLAEEVLAINISYEELRQIKTLGEIEAFVTRKVTHPAPEAPVQVLSPAAAPQPSQ